jgi:hypothetical protein
MRRAFLRAGFVTVSAAVLVAVSGCGGSDDESTATPPPDTAGTVSYPGITKHLRQQTADLTSFTASFEEQAEAYYDLAESAGFDPKKLAATDREQAASILADLKRLWIQGNPAYERMEGIVAGVPSLSQYDVILDAGSSAREDPASAVPFDLTLPGGRVVKQPGNLYNVTEGALWGTLPAWIAKGTPTDLDADGEVEFGEVLPDARLLVAAARQFDRYAGELQDAAAAWKPKESDAFTALVVMVPTMSEYFGQWKDSRFVAGGASTAEAFNVVSRLSDINDILASLRVIYGDVRPRIAKSSEMRAAQTGRELQDLSAFIEDLFVKEQAGKRFTRDQAEVLGTEAQDRGSAIAGQISQAAGSLGITIEQ